jgi:hypothetical protein
MDGQYLKEARLLGNADIQTKSLISFTEKTCWFGMLLYAQFTGKLKH